VDEVLAGARSYDDPLLTSQQQAAVRAEWSRRMDKRVDGLDLRADLEAPYSEIDQETGQIVTRGERSDSGGPTTAR
jgi:hypothetical protein